MKLPSSRWYLSIFLFCCLAFGFYVEKNISLFKRIIDVTSSTEILLLYFSIIFLNTILLFIFIFLSLRSTVNLLIERKTQIFGSGLKARLVKYFLFFSLLPTIVLLYISSKFIHANFDKWFTSSFPMGMDPGNQNLGLGIEVIQISYNLMLGVVTLLIGFSAIWLGTTVAREITSPIQVLAAATESVARGNYWVKIDDIVSDDEIGTLALSFRSMVSDLKEAQEQQINASKELKMRAEEIAETSEYNRILLRNISSSMFSIDEDERLTSWNGHAEQFFNVSENDALGKKTFEVFPHAFYESYLGKLIVKAKSSEKEILEEEFSFEWKGKETQLQVFVSQIHTRNNQKNFVFVIHEVTEWARAQRIAAWREVARRIAHEIKNPLTPIQLGTQRLERKFLKSLSEEDAELFKECTEIILQNTQSIKNLVNEFIYFSRMPRPQFQKLDLIQAVYLVLAGYVGHKESLELYLDINMNGNHRQISVEHAESDLPKLFAVFDRDQIMRLVSNLVSNAIAALQDKKRVDVSLTQSKDEKMVLIKITDWGSGISDKEKEKIFEPYFSTKKSGTGLGLVIARQIVDEHHGTLNLKDNPEGGSIFEIALPIKGGVYET